MIAKRDNALLLKYTMNQLTKIQKAAALLNQSPDQNLKEQSFSISLRLPGDVADRVLAIYDLNQQGAGSVSRNKLLVALIEAGLEAVENLDTRSRFEAAESVQLPSKRSK